MPTPGKNEIVLFTEDELPTAEAEVLSAIEKVLKQPTPDLLAIPMAILSVEMGWRSNLRQTKEAESFDAGQFLKTLQEKEQSARSRFPDQAIAAGSADQLIALQQQLRDEIASIASQRTDLETKRVQAQNDLQILFSDLEKGEKLSALFKKPAMTGANIPLSRPTVNVLSRILTVSPVKEETTLALSPDQDLLTAARNTIAASKTRSSTLTDDAITIEVAKRGVGRPRLSKTPVAVHFNVSAILEDEGIDLSQLTETNAQGVTVALKAYLRNDFKIPEPTPDEMESVLRDIVHGEYKGLLGDRKTLLALNGLATPKETAPVKVEEVELAEKVVFTAAPTVQPQRSFAASESKARKPLLVIEDNDPLAVALKTKKGGHLETQNAGDLAYGVTKVWLDSADKRADAGKKKEMSRLSSTIKSVVVISKAQKITSLDELIKSPAINLPPEVKDNLEASMRSIRETSGNEKFQLPVEALEYLPELITLRTNSPFKPKTMPDLLLLLAKKQTETKSSK